jgi:hypothetical protein
MHAGTFDEVVVVVFIGTIFKNLKSVETPWQGIRAL